MALNTISMKNGFLNRFEGRKIHLPEDKSLWPSIQNIEYHNKKIFGLLKKPNMEI